MAETYMGKGILSIYDVCHEGVKANDVDIYHVIHPLHNELGVTHHL